MNIVHEVVVTGPLQVNTHILGQADGDEVILMDPGGEVDQLLQRLKKLGKRLTHIVNTHGHADHIGAVARLQQLTGCQFWLHDGDREQVAKAARDAMSWGMSSFGPLPRIDRTLEHGEQLQLAGMVIEVIHTPGHTQGGVCLRWQDEIATGDTLFANSIGRTDLLGGNHSQLLQSIRDRLLSLPDRVICHPGHGPSTTIGRERRFNPFLSDGEEE
ncbi:MAG: MBL fold metallo-hydrolase [Magnetococcales bacterium]|nr:MBL fold metallo-hydrolase [Magnetococcales bacterium]